MREIDLRIKTIDINLSFINSDFAKTVPNGADLYVLPDDDEEVSEVGREEVDRLRREGRDVQVVIASKGHPENETYREFWLEEVTF